MTDPYSVEEVRKRISNMFKPKVKPAGPLAKLKLALERRQPKLPRV